MSSAGVTPKKQRKLEVSSPETEEESEYDNEIQTAWEEIDACQNEIDALNVKASEEILHVERTYKNLLKPYYEKRSEIIKMIPNFWVKAFVNHPQISAILEEEDEDCLHYLIKLEVEEFEDMKSGYRIHFYFEENPFFENTVLTKEFHLGTSGASVSHSTQINWKDSYELTKKTRDTTAAKGKNGKLNQKTFFQWFIDHNDPVADDIAEVIKEDMWPNPLHYYFVPDTEVENGVESDDN